MVYIASIDWRRLLSPWSNWPR